MGSGSTGCQTQWGDVPHSLDHHLLPPWRCRVHPKNGASPHLLLLALSSRALGDANAMEHDLHALFEGAGQLPLALLQVPLLQERHSPARNMDPPQYLWHPHSCLWGTHIPNPWHAARRW